MISNERWAGRTRFRATSTQSCNHFRSLITLSFGISTCFIAVVINMLLIIGGVELNPGSTGKDVNSSSTEHDLFDSGNY